MAAVAATARAVSTSMVDESISSVPGGAHSITPFDRSDIKDLISTLDDTIDQMHQTGKATKLYEVRDFDPSMRRMGDIIVQASLLTRDALPLLRSCPRACRWAS